ncbi:head GIN domain-containing protein [Paucibacter sp. AS339]|uniref:head GIN domain-containing protein n=1 Tax=Paucibacter hankyongi TaxID=3133434 RepID=UPI0030B4A38F
MSLRKTCRAVSLGLLSALLVGASWSQALPLPPVAPVAPATAGNPPPPPALPAPQPAPQPNRPQVHILVLPSTPAPPVPPPLPAAEGRLYTSRPFERVELSGSANVRLIQGERDQVFVAGDAEAQKAIELEFAGDRLQIRSVDGWKMWRNQRPQIDVTMRRLNQLVLSGAGDLHAPGAFKAVKLVVSISGAGAARFDDLIAERLDFGISGAGEGRISGQVNELNLRVSGKGRLQAENLQAQRASVSISGIGGAEVWATELLSLGVSGFGQIDYWGRPEVTRNSSGIARVNARGDKAVTARALPSSAP